MPKTINYVTVIDKVREVSLFGKANAATLTPLLKTEGLAPYSEDGQVGVLVSAVDARYKGIRFQELSVSIAVASDGYFLAHAFNSIKPFAFAERFFFQTPYYHAAVRVEPNHLVLSRGNHCIFEAALSPQATYSDEGYQRWEGAIHLPRKLRKQADVPHLFYAILEGEMTSYAPTLDTLTIQPMPDTDIFRMLYEAHLTIEQWCVRSNARHSKSKTYQMNCG